MDGGAARAPWTHGANADAASSFVVDLNSRAGTAVDCVRVAEGVGGPAIGTPVCDGGEVELRKKLVIGLEEPVSWKVYCLVWSCAHGDDAESEEEGGLGEHFGGR